jgi:hypothetical protein
MKSINFENQNQQGGEKYFAGHCTQRKIGPSKLRTPLDEECFASIRHGSSFEKDARAVSRNTSCYKGTRNKTQQQPTSYYVSCYV